MSFSPEWLALREPADHASISAPVRFELMQLLAARPTLSIVDLGCGAGSNLRGLSPWLGPNQSWTLVDYDQRLLDAARDHLVGYGAPRAVDIRYRRADFASGDFAPLLEGAELVTAAALFDLVSAAVIDKLADAVAERKQVFATVLTYDGIASWLPAHAADEAMRQAFNHHQHGDKGFGPAAGPDATDALAASFSRRGYRIVRAKSPWVLDDRFAKLRDEVDKGWAGAVAETGKVGKAELDAWSRHRTSAKGRVTIVGHEDILCIPPS